MTGQTCRGPAPLSDSPPGAEAFSVCEGGGEAHTGGESSSKRDQGSEGVMERGMEGE